MGEREQVAAGFCPQGIEAPARVWSWPELREDAPNKHRPKTKAHRRADYCPALPAEAENTRHGIPSQSANQRGKHKGSGRQVNKDKAGCRSLCHLLNCRVKPPAKVYGLFEEVHAWKPTAQDGHAGRPEMPHRRPRRHLERLGPSKRATGQNRLFAGQIYSVAKNASQESGPRSPA